MPDRNRVNPLDSVYRYIHAVGNILNRDQHSLSGNSEQHPKESTEQSNDSQTEHKKAG